VLLRKNSAPQKTNQPRRKKARRDTRGGKKRKGFSAQINRARGGTNSIEGKLQHNAPFLVIGGSRASDERILSSRQGEEEPPNEVSRRGKSFIDGRGKFKKATPKSYLGGKKNSCPWFTNVAEKGGCLVGEREKKEGKEKRSAKRGSKRKGFTLKEAIRHEGTVGRTKGKGRAETGRTKKPTHNTSDWGARGGKSSKRGQQKSEEDSISRNP